jgi:Ribonuclease G/E
MNYFEKNQSDYFTEIQEIVRFYTQRYTYGKYERFTLEQVEALEVIDVNRKKKKNLSLLI